MPHPIHANGWDNDTGENDDKPFAGLNIPSSEFVLNERRGVILRISPLPFTFNAKSKEVSSSRLMYYRCLFVVDYLIAFLVRPIKANIDSSRNRNSVIADIWYLRDQSGTLLYIMLCQLGGVDRNLAAPTGTGLFQSRRKEDKQASLQASLPTQRPPCTVLLICI